jgi:hypothetical protein
MKAKFENGHLFAGNGDAPSEIQGAALNGRTNGVLHRTPPADFPVKVAGFGKYFQNRSPRGRWFKPPGLAGKARRLIESSFRFKAVIKNAKQVEAAKKFVEYLSSEDAAKIFEKYGFIVLR